jgi:hypothetical protein
MITGLSTLPHKVLVILSTAIHTLQGVDWAEHPAAGVFAHSTDSSGRQLLMVRRAGCGLDDYGTVDARQVKRARIEGECVAVLCVAQTLAGGFWGCYAAAGCVSTDSCTEHTA